VKNAIVVWVVAATDVTIPAAGDVGVTRHADDG